MPGPQATIGRIVIYTDNQNMRHAAIVARDPDTPEGAIDLVVFSFHGTTAMPVYAKQGEGKGYWQWPERVEPTGNQGGAA